jgi:DNA repair exonuclease SbcCD ATPase subunit
MSYGNNTTVVELDRSGTTLIIGEDLDNTSGGTGANGVGKTVIINALAYAVYGKSLSNISKDNLVNNINKKNMEVTVTFEKDGTFYHIKRVRKSKNYAAGNYVKYYVKEGSSDFTDEDEATRDSVANTNKMIGDVIGIPFELFGRIVVFSALHTPFLDLPKSHPTQINQRSIIEELFSLTTLTEKDENLKKLIKENEQRLQVLQARQTQIERENTRHERQVDAAKQRVVGWEKQNTTHIAELKAKIAKADNVDVDAERLAHEEKTKIEKVISKLIGDQRVWTDGRNRLQKEVTKYEKELAHLKDAKCPYCLQKFADTEGKISELEEKIRTKNEKITINNEWIDKSEDGIDTNTRQLTIVKEKITVSNLDELIEIKSQAAAINGKIDELEEADNPFIEPLEEIEAEELDDVVHDETNKLVKYIEHQKFLHKLLTKKDSFVRKALLNKNIPYLNMKLQQYLIDLGLPHTVEFTHELTAVINQFGRPLDFGNLSNGQRARVNIALSLAFRDTLQQLHTKINVCMFDEVLDVGLDTIGVQAAAKLLKRKSRDEKLSLYIISHRDEINAAFDTIMTVQMSKGFSYIKED